MSKVYTIFIKYDIFPILFNFLINFFPGMENITDNWNTCNSGQLNLSQD